MRMCACSDRILNDKKGSLLCQMSVLDSDKSCSGTCVLPSIFLDTENNDPGYLPTVQKEVPHP
jgi:hypothetical protein